MLGNLQCLLVITKQGPFVLAVGAGGCCIDIFSPLSYLLSRGPINCEVFLIPNLYPILNPSI